MHDDLRKNLKRGVSRFRRLIVETRVMNVFKLTKLYALPMATLLLMATNNSDAQEAAVSQYKLPPVEVSETLTIEKKSIEVLGNNMTYLELGEGEPVVFVHGNPSSSYLWRNVLPHVQDNSRAIAVDLIGMGGSDKPDIAYSFADHYQYFSAFIDAMGIEQVTLVGHDWGAAIVWEYARMNPERVKALAFMEGVVPPAFPQPSFEAMGEPGGSMFRMFKDPVMGPKVLIDENMFVEKIIPMSVNRTLGEEAMAAYRAPFLDPASRKPVFEWPRAVPIAQEPQQSVDLLEDIGQFMGQTDIPVLLAYAEPGALIPPQALPWYTSRINNLETAFIGQGFHFIQEDQPDAIGRAIADWLRRH